MATKKSTNARIVPFIIMSLVTLIFLFWAMRQCGSGDRDYAMKAEEATRRSYLDSLRELDNQRILQVRLDSIEQSAKAAAMLRSLTQPLPGDSVVRVPASEVVIQRVTPLYSTIDGLNVRNGPTLKNGIIARLPLYTEVTFLGEVTDSLYEINLGDVTPKAPWVRVQLEDGKKGWVYGAGVSYYKYRLNGVIN
jgi:hypothetical protein